MTVLHSDAPARAGSGSSWRERNIAAYEPMGSLSDCAFDMEMDDTFEASAPSTQCVLHWAWTESEIRTEHARTSLPCSARPLPTAHTPSVVSTATPQAVSHLKPRHADDGGEVFEVINGILVQRIVCGVKIVEASGPPPEAEVGSKESKGALEEGDVRKTAHGAARHTTPYLVCVVEACQTWV